MGPSQIQNMPSGIFWPKNHQEKADNGQQCTLISERTYLDPKLKNECGLLSSIFNVERPCQRYLPKKPENAGVGEKQPHWKSVKCNFLKKVY